MDKDTFFQEYKGVIIAGAVIVVLGLIFLINFVFSSKNIVILNPAKPAAINSGETFTVAWAAKGISRVGVVIFNGDKPQWIINNYPASLGRFDWKVFKDQDSGADYRIAVFEYPWRKGNVITYAPYPTEIIGLKYGTCDDYSIEQEWPYIPISHINVRRVFVTQKRYTGNLGGLAGADAKCKLEAESRKYSGNYVAFLGDNSISANERITKDGIMVEADPIGMLAEGKTCHRFIAENLKEFVGRSLLSKESIGIKLSKNFSSQLGNVWYGRKIASASAKCLNISMKGAIDSFSDTTTCQNWSLEKRQVYVGGVPAGADLPSCYNSEGKNIAANYYGAEAGFMDSSGLYFFAGDTCDALHSLICIEQ